MNLADIEHARGNSKAAIAAVNEMLPRFVPARVARSSLHS